MGRTLLVPLLSVVFFSALLATLWNLKMQFFLLLIFVLFHLGSTGVHGDLCMYLSMWWAQNMLFCFNMMLLQLGTLVSQSVQQFICKIRSSIRLLKALNSLILVDVLPKLCCLPLYLQHIVCNMCKIIVSTVKLPLGETASQILD